VQDYMLAERTKERYERLIRDAETFRQALRSKKVQSSPILKSLIIFLIAVS
jgi:hypothetical protein